MAFLVSPGINVSEKDATTIVAGVSTTETGLAGVFRWGPVDVRTLVSSEAELVRKFGKPSNLNGETFFTGANFLSYGNALHVVRVMESGSANAVLNTYSAYANVGAVTTLPAVKNHDDYANTALDANVAWVAKYPGSLGSSLKVSVCDSALAFSTTISANDAGIVSSNLSIAVGGNTLAFTVTGNASNANTAANTFLGKIMVGDYIEVGNTTIGKQKLKVTAKTVATTVANVATATISVSTPYTLASDWGSNTVARTWEYANLFDKAPGVSKYMKDLGLTAVDEVHVVAVDEDGLFTGVPGTVLEAWPALSRATDAKTENGQGNYFRSILNASSLYLWVGTDRSGAAAAQSASLVTSTNQTPYTASLGGGVDGATESTVSLGKLAAGYDLFRGAEDVDISIILQGKARGISPDSDTVPSSGAVNYSTLANYILSNVAEYRKDCVVCVSPAKADSVTAADKATAQVAYMTNINLATSYGFMDSGYKYQYDKYNDVYRWVPLNGDTAGCMVRTDFDRDPWYSPAGAQRGQIKNVVKLGFNPNQAERDILYKAGINPVIIKKGSGTLLFGDKTLLGRPSAFGRINVRRLFIVLEKAIATASQFALFEFNDSFTRNRFISIVEPYLRDVQGRRGIYDFRVVCDETNNTPQVIDTNGFVGDIYIKPARSINFIQLNFVAVATGVQFDEIVGQI